MPVALRPCRSSANADAASATSARALRSSRWGELLCFRASCASVSLMATQGHGSDFERPSLQTVMKRSWESSSDRDWAEVLHALPLFSTMGKRQVQKLARVASVRDYEPDENLVRVGEPGDSFYVLLEGRASVAGKSRVLRPGDFFGEMALLDGGPRSATITATTPVRAIRLPRPSFTKAIEQDPRIGLCIMAVLAARVRRTERALSA
jgi:CRP/FNR family transcriptional regulator, cyclic AMP receptor protein